MDFDDEVERVKKDLVELIIKHLKEKKIASEKAKRLASDFLKMLPIEDRADLLSKLKDLGKTYQEARDVYIEEVSKEDISKRSDALSTMKHHIQQGDIEQAITVAKSLTGSNNNI